MIDMTKTKEIAWELGQKLGEVAEDAYKQGFDDGSNDKQQTKGEWVATGRMFVELNGEQIVYEVLCDQCKGLSYFRKVTSVLFGAEYCPCCGVKMGGQKWID